MHGPVVDRGVRIGAGVQLAITAGTVSTPISAASSFGSSRARVALKKGGASSRYLSSGQRWRPPSTSFWHGSSSPPRCRPRLRPRRLRDGTTRRRDVLLRFRRVGRRGSGRARETAGGASENSTTDANGFRENTFSRSAVVGRRSGPAASPAHQQPNREEALSADGNGPTLVTGRSCAVARPRSKRCGLRSGACGSTTRASRTSTWTFAASCTSPARGASCCVSVDEWRPRLTLHGGLDESAG